jgi:hypothetical protein
VIGSWSPLSRISPIFPFRDGRILRRGEPEDRQFDEVVLFIGGLHPALYRDRWQEEGWAVWCTFGIMNLVVSLPDASARNHLLPWLQDLGLPFELWTRVSDGLYLSDVAQAQAPTRYDGLDVVSRIAALKLPTELGAPVAELVAQASAALTRAAIYFPDEVPQIVRWLDEVSGTLEGLSSTTVPASDIYQALALLIQLNAGLSRFTSQALSGIAPVLLTECHFWTHSLLGAGVAVRGLTKLVRSLERAVGDARLPQKLGALSDPHVSPRVSAAVTIASSSPGALTVQDDLSPVWEIDLNDVPLDHHIGREPLIPSLAFYSARDGFRSTAVTLSAALAAVANCSSRRWSLVTATHEMSHSLVRGYLAELYPGFGPSLPSRHSPPDSPYTVEKAYALWDASVGEENPGNLLDMARLLVIDTLVFIDDVEARYAEGEEDSDQEDQAEETVLERGCDSPDDLAAMATRWRRELEELMTHVLDFLLFYDANESAYIASLWLSWSTIPNIGSRVREYVMRTLAAMLSGREQMLPQTVDLVARDLDRTLRSIQGEHGDTPYLDAARRLLNRDSAEWARLREELLVRVPLVRLTSRLLVSATVRGKVNDPAGALGAASERVGHPQQAPIVDGEAIPNPLHFVHAFSWDGAPAIEKSLWLLTMLAFNA